MKLPFRPSSRRRKAAAGAQPRAGLRGRLSLRRQKTLLLAAGVVLILTPVVLVGLQAAGQASTAAREQSALAAKLFAAAVHAWMDRQLATAEMLAKDPRLVRLLAEGSDTRRDNREEELASVFPSAIRVRLLPPGVQEVDLEGSAPLSYAALDMLRHAETGDRAPPVEVHMSGTPRQHISLLRSILDPAGGRLVGHLMVSFPVQELQEALSRPRIGGYAELQQLAAQTPLVLATRGPADMKRSRAAAQAAVPDSRWRVAYWPAPSAQAGNTPFSAAALAGAGAAAVFAVIVWLVFRRIGSALRQDQATLLAMVRDVRDGRLKREYPTRIVELRDSSWQLARTAAAGTARAQKPAPPAAEPAGAAQILDEVDTDPLFDDAALDVARVDVEHWAVDPSIFRAYDIRGVVGDTLSPEVAYELGRAIGSEAYYRGEQTVVVGRDGRLSGSEIAQALMRGLKATGRDVKDVGQVPTPVLYFAAQHLDSGSGVMVTGSHNPPDYNGFKIVLAGQTLAREAIQGLRQRIEQGDLLTGDGSLEQVDVLAEYIQRVEADVQVARPVKVVVDCGNGVAGLAAPRLLRALGCEVTDMYCDVDGNFPNHHPDPSKVENLSDLIQAVGRQGAELGIALDGDGDRVGVVGSGGEIIWPDRLLMLFAMDVLSRNPGAPIIYDVKCSRHVADVIRQYGGEPLMCATGHSLIKAKMKETGALLAGEMSGHIFFKERWFGFDDALYTAARLVEILANDHRCSSDIFAELPDSVNTPELTVSMAEGEPERFMEKLREVAQFDDASVIAVDGLRVEFEHGWGLVRASNTTPSLVLRFEARDELALSRIQDAFRRAMLRADPGLSLPF
jgi:phosphomannomutase/phosphoglucomutase